MLLGIFYCAKELKKRVDNFLDGCAFHTGYPEDRDLLFKAGILEETRIKEKYKGKMVGFTIVKHGPKGFKG